MASTTLAPPVGGAPTLDVAIVSYRCRALLDECLSSLAQHGARLTTRVFVADNASRDGTVELVRARYPAVTLLALDENVGFGAATNRIIRAGTGTYVLALNPDTRMTGGALDALVELMEARSEIGIAGCRLETDDGSLDHAAKRSFPTPVGALAHFLRIGRLERAPAALSQYRAPEVERGPVDAVNGAFMLMRRAALDEVGLFDEGYWMYMEDLDLCYRFARAGWVTWYEPSVTVHHVKAGTSGKLRRPRLNYAFHYGMFRFYRKHYAAGRAWYANWLVYAGIAAKLGASIAVTEARRAAAAAGRARGASDPAAVH